MDNRIFKKPLPSSLLNYASFDKHIFAKESLLQSGLGFHTYTEMVEHWAKVSLAICFHPLLGGVPGTDFEWTY